VRRALLPLAVVVACSSRPSTKPNEPTAIVMRDAGPIVDASTIVDAGPVLTESDASVDAETPDDPMALHHENETELRALFQVLEFSPEQFNKVRPDLFLSHVLGPVPTRMNQGNKLRAHHEIGKRACMKGLEGIVLQTDEQRRRCGAPNMVPVYRNGDPKTAAYCIDVFEFPNQPCELPFVWTAPTHAQTMCNLQGKRLCTQGEWNLACRADPSGGADRTYAYGDSLDLTVCNTNKTHVTRCDPRTLQGAWDTCGTDTEPTGSFPQCRSRFGVFDQHGNVAEVMTRKEDDGRIVTQLKGSAFFYKEVSQYSNAEYLRAAQAHETLPLPRGDVETYPDHCNYDPRWHVEPITGAWHVNYHLGFRCCKTISPE
jgi:formylglycine-generating enzyme required for sulfatase activity